MELSEYHPRCSHASHPLFTPSEHVTSIIAALFRNVSGAHHQRLVGKFTESDHAKVDRLMELHFNYLNRVQACDDKIEQEKQVLMT